MLDVYVCLGERWLDKHVWTKWTQLCVEVQQQPGRYNATPGPQTVHQYGRRHGSLKDVAGGNKWKRDGSAQRHKWPGGGSR